MATATRHLCRSIFQASRRIPAKRKCNPVWRSSTQTPAPRPFTTAVSWQAEDQSQNTTATESDKSGKREREPRGLDLASIDTTELMTPAVPLTVQDLSPAERADYEALSKDLQPKWLAVQNHVKAAAESPEAEAEMDRAAERLGREIEREAPLEFPTGKLLPREVGLWAEDEDDEFGKVEDGDEEFDETDITSVAHSELELHRDIRDYTRVATWDMPLLSKFAKPFEPPPLSSPLRFRYTTYMGEAHPAAKKVVVQFCTRDLSNLTEGQRIKLIKLVGVRYNPDTDVVKMSCEKFEAPAQNKRYLGDLIGNLIKEATAGEDQFQDVPLDFRHHKPKKTYTFPEEWKMSPERVQQLIAQRQEARLLGAGRQHVNGKEAVEVHLAAGLKGSRIAA